MITEANISACVHLDWKAIEVAMLSIWGFTEEDIADITGLDKDTVKKVRTKLRDMLSGINSQNMAFHAQKAGFKLDGTLHDEDIFTNKKKLKILLVDPIIEFRFPPV